ncbi:MAG TPA: hypothetical protein VFW31_05670 [Candidatus Angelobacter sp.]|nr:hypothetical protein [Candidatus Angelobacter sp.]
MRTCSRFCCAGFTTALSGHELGHGAVIGRPVRFADAFTEEDEKFALARLEAAARRSGIEEVVFEYEPVAAAYQYERA